MLTASRIGFLFERAWSSIWQFKKSSKDLWFDGSVGLLCVWCIMVFLLSSWKSLPTSGDGNSSLESQEAVLLTVDWSRSTFKSFAERYSVDDRFDELFPGLCISSLPGEDKGRTTKTSETYVDGVQQQSKTTKITCFPLKNISFVPLTSRNLFVQTVNQKLISLLWSVEKVLKDDISYGE